MSYLLAYTVRDITDGRHFYSVIGNCCNHRHESAVDYCPHQILAHELTSNETLYFGSLFIVTIN